MKRAYSLLQIKALDDDQRVIEGIASTPSVDRQGDIVEPEGMEANFPVPFLYQHDSASPIGHVLSATRSGDAIKVKVKLATIEEPGALKERLDMAWQSIKTGLVRGLSIGFRAIESARIDGTYGMRFLKWELLELSAVTVPANQDATITSIKSIDKQMLAASGHKQKTVVKLDPLPGASGGKSTSTQKSKDKDMNIAEKIKQFEATRAAKVAKMAEIMEASDEEGTTLDAAQSEEYDTLEGEVKSIDEHLKRLDGLQKANIASAKAIKADDVNGDSTRSSASRDTVPAQVQLKKELPKGIEFARFVMCVGAAKGNVNSAYSFARTRFADSPRVVNALKLAAEMGTPDVITAMKTAVAAASTTDTTWAAPLVEYNQFAGDFVEFLRPQTIIGKFGMNGIPALRSVPFNVNIRAETTGASAGWVGEGKAKPVTKAGYDNVYLGYTKVAAIAVLTEELLRFSNPSAEMLVRDALSRAVIERIDTDFVDPAVTATSARPASITQGVVAINSSGNDADGIREDVAQAMSTYIAANITPTTGVWIMPATVALRLSLMRNALGQKEFPDITMLGGTFEGLPVIVSEYVPTDSNGSYIILANASDIWLADDGQVVVDASREASIEMDTAPEGASYAPSPSPSPVPAELVSMFQTNSVAIRAERWINWKKRRAAAVAVLSGVNWGVSGS